MSNDSIPNNLQGQTTTSSPNIGRKKKQKIKIKYRERYRIKERPRAYKLRKFWKKNRINVITAVMLSLLLGGTLFMIASVLQQRIEINKINKDLHQRRF